MEDAEPVVSVRVHGLRAHRLVHRAARERDRFPQFFGGSVFQKVVQHGQKEVDVLQDRDGDVYGESAVPAAHEMALGEVVSSIASTLEVGPDVVAHSPRKRVRWLVTAFSVHRVCAAYGKYRLRFNKQHFATQWRGGAEPFAAGILVRRETRRVVGCDPTLATIGLVLLVAIVADFWISRWAATLGFLRGTLGLSRAVVGFLFSHGLVLIVAIGAVVLAYIKWRTDFAAFADAVVECLS